MLKISWFYASYRPRTAKRLSWAFLQFFLLANCKSKIEDSSVEGTSRGQQDIRCNSILNDMKTIAVPIFRQVMAVADGRAPAKNRVAKEVAIGSKQMFENMVRSPTQPVIPLHFFAMIKDFETSQLKLAWSRPNNRKSVFSRGDCGADPCYGYFQVNVRAERPVWDPAICESNGLDVAKFKGGYDFCAALFWWIRGEGGRKCQSLVGKKGVHTLNPCRDRNVTWTEDYVAKGRSAYRQSVQDGGYGNRTGWKDKYNDYVRCDTATGPWSKVDLAQQFMLEISAPRENPYLDGPFAPSNANVSRRLDEQLAGSNMNSDPYGPLEPKDVDSQSATPKFTGDSAGDFNPFDQQLSYYVPSEDNLNELGFDERDLTVNRFEVRPSGLGPGPQSHGTIDLDLEFPRIAAARLNIAAYGKGDGFSADRIAQEKINLNGQKNLKKTITFRQDMLWLYLDWFDENGILVFTHEFDLRATR